ncbi:hypothetical protein BHE74_00047915 [Ensete ventricosum]|nr:hypothetical protein BHE74_00047915 [Ensete ventricosum]
MGIMYIRTIIKISQIHRGRIVLFAKGCPNPIFPFCATVVAAPAEAAAALARRQPPLRSVSCPQAAPLWTAAPAAGRPLAGSRPLQGAGRSRPLPCRGALVVVGHPLAGGRAMPGCPSSSLPSLRKRSKNT